MLQRADLSMTKQGRYTPPFRSDKLISQYAMFRQPAGYNNISYINEDGIGKTKAQKCYSGIVIWRILWELIYE